MFPYCSRVPAGRLIAIVECRVCGRVAELPVEALGERRGPALWRSLRCTGCRMLGRAEVRLVLQQASDSPLAAGHGQDTGEEDLP
jgi:hypothetical protein